MNLGTCVSPSGQFVFGVHKPAFKVENFRESDAIETLGLFLDQSRCDNEVNFPTGAVDEPSADWIYEIRNPLPFRGTTYIGKRWADSRAKNPMSISLKPKEGISFFTTVETFFNKNEIAGKNAADLIRALPEPMQLALATTSNDPDDLVCLAKISCEFILDDQLKKPMGLVFEKKDKGSRIPLIHNEKLFEAVANNPALPDVYKVAMVLRPGVQGNSEIVGEWSVPEHASHIYEYLRRNSYIPWGHYAANMASDAVRYGINTVSHIDMEGLRRLYYQRTYSRIAGELGVGGTPGRKTLSENQLERLRQKILFSLNKKHPENPLTFNRTLWGWNFGFDYAPTHYRLHASHQQIHQQFAMIPERVPTLGCGHRDDSPRDIPSFACGDLVERFVKDYKAKTGKDFFECYVKAIRSNTRIDNRQDKPDQLVVYEDKQVMLFVPKAQTSQWELQLMPVIPVGNIVEADTDMRRALDRAILVAVRILSEMGAGMITSIEYSKPIGGDDTGQRLLYSFLPRLPESPGAFSEAQLRWINGHYPEDFCAACRATHLTKKR